jgi:hypothetical protein
MWPEVNYTTKTANTEVQSYKQVKTYFAAISIKSNITVSGGQDHSRGITRVTTTSKSRFLYLVLKIYLHPLFRFVHSSAWSVKKGEVMLLHAMEALEGRGGIAPTHT